MQAYFLTLTPGQTSMNDVNLPSMNDVKLPLDLPIFMGDTPGMQPFSIMVPLELSKEKHSHDEARLHPLTSDLG